MLEIEKLRKTYGGGVTTVKALKEISVTFSPGEIVGLFGENGAGKTTLFKCILRYFVYLGKITLDGQPITYRNIGKVAYGSSENTVIGHLNVSDHKGFFAMNFPQFNESRFDLLTDFFGLPTNRQIKKLSQGQKNQVETILALSQGATYILLDEPFMNSDIFDREDFYKVLLGLLRPDECLILSSHLIDELRNFVSRVVLLRGGKIIGDKTTDDLDQEGLELIAWMKELYGYENRAAEFIRRAEGNIQNHEE